MNESNNIIMRLWKNTPTPAKIEELMDELTENRFERDYEFKNDLSMLYFLASEAGYKAASSETSK